MIQKCEQVKSTVFPQDLEFLWGKTVTAKGSIVRRSVIELSPKGGKPVKMPILDLVDVHINGYDGVIQATTVAGPAFWRSKAHCFDKVEFEGRLIKERGNVVGFKSIKGVKVFSPVQTALDDFVEVEGFGEEIWGSEQGTASQDPGMAV